MNTYERMLELIVEISKEDLEYYKGRPSRKKVKKKAKKKAKKKSAEAEEADDENEAFRTTSMKESTPIEETRSAKSRAKTTARKESTPIERRTRHVPYGKPEMGPHEIGKGIAAMLSAMRTQLAGGKKTFASTLRQHHIGSVKTQARKHGRAALKKNRELLAAQIKEARKSPAERRFRAREAMKKAKAKRQGKSTVGAAEAHRMGRLSAESLAAGNPKLAKRQRKEGEAAKRGTLKRTSPSTVYGRSR